MAKKTTTKKSDKKKTKAKTGSKKKTLKKTAAKKTTGKKVAKKKVTKKPVAKKKTAAKKAAPKKKTTAKKTVAKKAASKKKTAAKKVATTAAKKKAIRRLTAVKPDLKKETAKVEEAKTLAEIRAQAIKKIKGYGKRDLEHFKKIILEKRDEIIEQLQSLRDAMLDPTTGEYINENSPYSLHMAEQGTDAMEREKTYLYAQRENKFLGYLEDALKRIENGIYGICIECIEEPQYLCETCPLIPKERLEAVPHSQHCLPIKQRQEKR